MMLIVYFCAMWGSYGLTELLIKRHSVSESLNIAELKLHQDALAREIVKMKADNEANNKYVYDVVMKGCSQNVK